MDGISPPRHEPRKWPDEPHTKFVPAQAEGVDLSVVPTGDFLEVRVPPIAVHSMVVIEY